MLLYTLVEQNTGYDNLPKKGTVTTLPIQDIEAATDWLKYVLAQEDTSLVAVSRLSPRRFNSIVSMEEINYHWMTNKDSPVGIKPSLERVNHLLQEYVQEGTGIIWLEGLEYLISKHGFNPVLTFIRALVDEMSKTDWSLMLPFSSLSMESNEYAKLKREAPNWFPSGILEAALSVENVDPIPQLVVEETPVDEVHVDDISIVNEVLESPPELEFLSSGDIPLKHLTSIPEAAFTPRTLRERILAWRRMGLDVSSLEPALKYSDITESYQLYLDVENSVKNAVDLDRKIDTIEGMGYSTETFKFRFMIRQLTGLERVSNLIDEMVDKHQS